jgi:hypothetical protein
MSFVKIYEEIIENHSDSADFSDAEMISVVWETTPESIEKLLPSPLKPADSYVYQIRSGITDDEMFEQCRSMINKFDLEKQWYTGARVISSSKGLFDLYQAYVNNTYSGEKVIYQSP